MEDRVVCPHCGEEIRYEDIQTYERQIQLEVEFESHYQDFLRRLRRLDKGLILGCFLSAVIGMVLLTILVLTQRNDFSYIFYSLAFITIAGLLGIITNGFFLCGLKRARLWRSFLKGKAL